MQIFSFFLTFFSLLVISANVFGEMPQPKSLSALSTELKGSQFRGVLLPGFHFNYKAPNQVDVDGAKIKPVLKNPTRIEFRVPKELKKASAELYVCDDAVTYCETLTVELVTAKPARLISLADYELEKPTVKTEPKELKKNKYGFYEGSFEKVLEKAQKEKTLVLANFSAIWCPGCLRLKEEIYPQAAFRGWTKKMNLVYLDTDKFENHQLAKKYEIKGVPTLLVLTATGKEIQRVYDYQPLNELDLFFALAQKFPLPLDEMKKDIEAKAVVSDEMLNILGDRLFYASRLDEALNIYQKAKVPSIHFWDLQVARAKETKNDQTLKETLQKAIAADPRSIRSLGWRADLLPLLEKDQKGILDEGVKLADHFLSQPKELVEAGRREVIGEFTGFEKLMVAMMKADLQTAYLTKIEKKARDGSEVKAAWKDAAQISRPLFSKPASLGPSLRYFITVMASGDYVEAEKLITRLISRFPEDFDLYRRKLRVLVLLEKYPEAIQVGQKSLEKSYGRNEFWVVEFLAKAYQGANQTNQAQNLVAKYLAREELKADNMKSTRETLEKLSQDLNSIKR